MDYKVFTKRSTVIIGIKNPIDWFFMLFGSNSLILSDFISNRNMIYITSVHGELLPVCKDFFVVMAKKVTLLLYPI